MADRSIAATAQLTTDLGNWLGHASLSLLGGLVGSLITIVLFFHLLTPRMSTSGVKTRTDPATGRAIYELIVSNSTWLADAVDLQFHAALYLPRLDPANRARQFYIRVPTERDPFPVLMRAGGQRVFVLRIDEIVLDRRFTPYIDADVQRALASSERGSLERLIGLAADGAVQGDGGRLRVEFGGRHAISGLTRSWVRDLYPVENFDAQAPRRRPPKRRRHIGFPAEG